jgi:cyclopropane-fatty-acyl-phospholipid synthase
MQVRKIDSLCQRLDLQRGEHVLDIGCGKGGFARHATTRYGVHVDGITTSDNHFAAAERARQEGIQNISFYNLDYRDISTSFRDNFFDAVVSIGMLEHVGAKNYLRFFQEVCDSLKPGGRGIIHTIASTEKGGIQDPWIQLEEFPGGYIPHQDEVTDAMFRAGLTPDFERIFRMKEDYAVTLEQWASNAKTAEEELRQADPDFFNDRFFRRKRFFHHGCAAAFRHGDLYVLQVPFAKPRRKADNT